FYRTGKILLLDEIMGSKNSSLDITHQELIEEIKYFQIPLPRRDIPTDQYHAELLDKFVEALKDGICEARYDFHSIFGAEFAPIGASKKNFVTVPPEGNFKRLFEPFRYNGYKIIELFGKDIEEHIKSSFTDITFSIIEGEVEENDVGYKVYVIKIEIGDEAWDQDAILNKSNVVINTPIGKIAQGANILISWELSGPTPMLLGSLRIQNKNTGESTNINDSLDLSIRRLQWRVNVSPGTYILAINDGSGERFSGEFQIVQGRTIGEGGSRDTGGGGGSVIAKGSTTINPVRNNVNTPSDSRPPEISFAKPERVAPTVTISV
ncbi:9690_t:CDS:2, partial [Acaulospora colombiana]